LFVRSSLGQNTLSADLDQFALLTDGAADFKYYFSAVSTPEALRSAASKSTASRQKRCRATLMPHGQPFPPQATHAATRMQPMPCGKTCSNYAVG